ncbi:DUF4365 domain-containing protein [Nocardiopsis alborubida]|uniref:DUF4365 domain-containing protein n=1 Tax=Nocardiopsis alborubida TaxID=146802 RepID=A0A7X6MIB5_9ACTN|nr:DUF4365 domain-containing protein [Nocardiopsis alborubida]NKY99990.1 DUF4365 domain-containing protein [Nocardiopsis alborubida]
MNTLRAGRPTLSLERNVHQGHYGEHFTSVLAAAAGLQVSKPFPDFGGTDLTIGYPGSFGGLRHPSIEVQVKSWSRAQGAGNHWSYDGLNQVQFNELAGPGFRCPRFLVLVIVPSSAEDYVYADHESLRLSHAAYWASFRHLDPVEPASRDKKQRVQVPKANLLTTKTLRDLLVSTDEVEGP